MFGITLWLIFAALVGVFASQRGRSGLLFFLLSLVLSPLIGFIIAVLAGKGESELLTITPEPDWATLSKYDPDVSAAIDYLSPYGIEAVARFREIYSKAPNKQAAAHIASVIAHEAHDQNMRAAWLPKNSIRRGAIGGIPIYKLGSYKIYWVLGRTFSDEGSAKKYASFVSRTGALA